MTNTNIIKSILYHMLGMKYKVFIPKGNFCSIGNGFKFKNCRISVKGYNNKISMGNNFRIKDFTIKIYGKNNEIIIGNNILHEKAKLVGNLQIYINGSNNKIIIGDNIQIVTELIIYNHENSQNCKIEIGNDTTFYKTEIYNYDIESSIKIGEDCMFGYDTIIYNTDGHAIFQNGNIINQAKNLTIGNHVWCGWGSTILKNSYIPNGCIVGKSAIVSKKFNEENAAIAGNPAKIIKENISWNRKTVNQILQEKS